MAQEQFKSQEKEGSSLRQEIVNFEDIVHEAEKAPEKDLKDRLDYIRVFTGNLFRNNPGKWPEEDVQSVYSLAKRVGVLGAGDNVVRATEYVRSVVKELAKKSTDASFKSKLKYETTHFRFSRQIDYSWLEESALNELNTTNQMLNNWGKTLTPDNFENVFSNLSGSWLEDYVTRILDKAPKGTEKDISFARGKIKANLAFNFYVGLVPNTKISIDDKKKVLDMNVAIVDGMPGLFGEKRTMLAEATGTQLETKKGKKSGKRGEKVSKGPAKKPEFKGPTTPSERISERRRGGLSVASVNPEDVVLFDYQESKEIQLEMPEAMKVQMNSIALIHDLAAMLLKGGKIDLATSNKVVTSLNYVQYNLVEYYKDEKYDGKTPFNLEEEMEFEMSSSRLKGFINAANKVALSPVKTAGMSYRNEFLKLLSGKSLTDMDEVKKAGFAIAWMERNVFGDHMSARGLMSKLLHKDVMAAREKLPPEVKEQLYEKAYSDARKSITSMLSDGTIRENFRANFKKRYLKDNNRLPADTQIDAAYSRFFSSLFESQHISLYDSYLTLASFSDKYMKPAPTSGVDKTIYDEFCDSTDPNNDFFKLSDEGRAVLWGVTKEVIIMAAAMIVTAGVGLAARAAAMAVRGLSMVRNATTIARYAVEAAMFTGTVAAEAGAFYDVNAVLHGEATIAGTLLVDRDWKKAGIMLASEMPMFMLLGGAHYLAGFSKMGMATEAKVLVEAGKRYPKYAKEIKDILELAKSSPKKAIQAVEAALAKGGLPKEIAQRYARIIDNVGILSGRYRGVLGKISDPFLQKAVGVLVVDLNFDAAAIMLGTYLKEKINPVDDSSTISKEERGAIEAVLFEWGKAYLMAAGFKAAFGGVGKLARKVPDVLERVLPQGLRERLIQTYRNDKGEFIGRDGLMNMLISKLEVGGFDDAIAQMEKAKVLILTVEDVLSVTSQLPEGKAMKFLQTCKRMMKPEERQLVIDEVTAMQKSSALPEGFAHGRSEMPMDKFRGKWPERSLGGLITAKILGLVLRVFSPEAAAEPVERPVAEATVKSGEVREGKFPSKSSDRVSKTPKASEKPRVVVAEAGAKAPVETSKDSGVFDSILNAIKEGKIKDIDGLKAVFAANQENFAKEIGYDSNTKTISPEKTMQFASVIGVTPQQLNESVAKASIGGLEAWWIIAFLIYSVGIRGFLDKNKDTILHKNWLGNGGWGKFFAVVLNALTRGALTFPQAIIPFPTFGLPLMPALPLYDYLRGRREKNKNVKLETPPELDKIIYDKKDGHLGLNEHDYGELHEFYEAIKTIFSLLEFKSADEAKKFFESLIRWKHAELRLHEINTELTELAPKLTGKRQELAPLKNELARKQEEERRIDADLASARTEAEIKALGIRLDKVGRDISRLEGKIQPLEKEVKELEDKGKALNKEQTTVRTKAEKLKPSGKEIPVAAIAGGEKGEKELLKNIEALLESEGVEPGDKDAILKLVKEFMKILKLSPEPGTPHRKIHEMEARLKAQKPEYDKANAFIVVEEYEGREPRRRFISDGRYQDSVDLLSSSHFDGDIARARKIVSDYQTLVRKRDAAVAGAGRGLLMRLGTDQMAFAQNHPKLKFVLEKVIKFLLLYLLYQGGKGLWNQFPDAPTAPASPATPAPKPPSKPALERPSSAPTPAGDDVKPEEATGEAPGTAPKTTPGTTPPAPPEPETPPPPPTVDGEAKTPKKGVKALDDYIADLEAKEKAAKGKK